MGAMSIHRRSRHARLLLAALALCVSVLGLAGCGTTDTAQVTNPHAPTVALSNSFTGNIWRQTMVNKFADAAKDAQTKGLISDFKIYNAPGNNSATEQIAQIRSILLQKPDLLLIDPASPTALAPVIGQACKFGITVVVFDSGINSDCAYVVTNSFPDWGTTATEAIAKGIGGHGNVLVSRGVVGSAPEAEFYAAQLAVLNKNPGIKTVGTVTGLCDSGTAQKAVLAILSSLPEVNGVAGCGDGMGIAQAFQTAGRPIPTLAFEPSGRALKFWADNSAGKGSIAMMSDPGRAIAALYTGLEILDHQPVDKTTTFPSVLITEQDRDEWLQVVGTDRIASWPWTQDLVRQQIALSKENKLVAPPVPTV
jgi:ribose transport system substrate-binding protein